MTINKLLRGGFMQAIDMSNAKGIDVSNYDTNVDWAKVKAAGYSFAFIKSTEGVTFVDQEFSRSYSNARANSIITGPYHYARPYNDAIKEADFFVDTVRSFNGFQNGDLPPVLDIESNAGLGRAEIVRWCRTFINRVKDRTGLQPMLYTYLYFAKDYLDESLGDVPLWFARYGVNSPEDVAGWSKWTFLQYSDTGAVDGVNATAVDLNFFYGDETELIAFVNGTPSLIPSPNPTLRLGDTGKTVEGLQKQLAEMEYYTDNIDGIFGPNTDKAVRLFQSINGLAVDGIVGPNTWYKLMNSPIKYPGTINNTGVLKLGDSGDAVTKLQSNLASLGFSPGTIDGIFGPNTEAAVRGFQSAYGITIDGIAGPQTLKAIDIALNLSKPTLSVGDSGAAVSELQQCLLNLGYSVGPVDGIFGRNTKRAVLAFQGTVGLTPDGIVGPKTWVAILVRS